MVFALNERSPEGKVAAPVKSAATGFNRPVSHGLQEFRFPDTHAPVSAPVPKYASMRACKKKPFAHARLPPRIAFRAVSQQVSGEAQFTDDIPAAHGTLYGAWVVTTEANGKITGIDFKV